MELMRLVQSSLECMITNSPLLLGPCDRKLRASLMFEMPPACARSDGQSDDQRAAYFRPAAPAPRIMIYSMLLSHNTRTILPRKASSVLARRWTRLCSRSFGSMFNYRPCVSARRLVFLGSLDSTSIHMHAFSLAPGPQFQSTNTA